MTVLGSQWLGSGGGGATFDTEIIGNSIWLDGSADYLTKTWAGAGNRTRWLLSWWFRLGSIGTDDVFFSANVGTNDFYIRMDGTDSKYLTIHSDNASGSKRTVAALRDTAWYHAIVSLDTNDADASDRVRMYINGEQQTLTNHGAAGDFSSGGETYWNNTQANEICRRSRTSSSYLNGYMAQVCFLDGQSIQNSDVAVSDFLDTFTFGDNGSQFIPKTNTDIASLATTAAGNSFCLGFDTSADLGNDLGGQNNDFTLSSIAAANQSVDTPSLTYPVFSDLTNIGNVAFLNGNTRVDILSGSSVIGNVAIPDGSWYWEVKYAGGTLSGQATGIATFDLATAAEMGYNSPASPASADQRGIYVDTGSVGNGFSLNPFTTSYGSGQATDTYTGIAVTKSGTSWNIWFSESGTYPNSGNPATGANPAMTWTSVYEYTMCCGNWSGNNQTIDLVMVPADWQATVPSGFLSLASNNLPTPSYQGVDYFKPLLYAGNGTAIGSGGKAVTGTGFQPDFTWIKNRDALDDHSLYDSVRGVTKQIETNNTAAETTEAESLTTFGTDGFTVGSLAQVNTNTENYVSYSWAAGGSSSSNGSGSITSTVTAANAGHFSVVNWTGNTTLAATVGHGLGGTPEFIIAFNRNTSAENRPVYHQFMTSDNDHLKINEANAQGTAGSTIWDVSGMTSTVIGLGAAAQSNGSTATDCMIAYCFRSVPGVCKAGAYYGNNVVDGPFVWTGFKVVYLFLKNLNGANPWMLYDSARDTYNPTVRYLHPNTNAAGADGAGTRDIDLLSNGFKLRENDSDMNSTSSNRYVYVAMGSLGGNGTLPPIYGQ